MQIDNTLLKYLVPIKQLQDEHRVEIAEQSQILELGRGEALSAQEEDRWYVYLIAGRIDLFEANESPLSIDADEIRAYHPLFNEDKNTPQNKKTTRMVADTRCLVVRFDRQVFHAFLEQELNVGDGTEAPLMNEIEANLYNEIMRNFNTGQLKLPCLQVISSKVKTALNNPKISLDEMVMAISADPVLTAQLIHAANKLLEHDGYTNTSVLEAITALGKQTSKELVVHYVSEHTFVSKSHMLMQRMVDCYDNSIDIAAIGFALSKQGNVLAAENVFVAGLLHEIGVIPIISYIEETGLIVNGEDELERIIDSLRSAVGVLVIRQLGLSNDLVAVVDAYENWQRQKDREIDNGDMIIIAQIYHRLKHHKIEGLPKIEQVPAFKKLSPANQNPDFAKSVFRQAHELISQTMQLLKLS